MNREIKFRVWSRVKNTWVHNMMLLACIDGLPFAHFVEITEDKSVIHHVYNASNLDVVIQQYTGLKDKNDKDIYEGDIVKYDRHDDPVIIRWTDEGMDYTGWIFEDLFTQGGPFEIIGNIFQNPELIKQ